MTSAPPTNDRAILRLLSLLSAIALVLVGAPEMVARDDAKAANAGQQAIIYLKNGGNCSGKLIDAPSGDNLLWQGDAFTAPFTFPVDAVNVVQFPAPAKLPQPVGDFCFELTGGDLLFGSLVELDGDVATIDADGIGRLHIERPWLSRMFRWKGGNLVYYGPSGVRGWESVDNSKVAWRDEAGRLIADHKAAAIRGDFGAPALACFEFELSWTERPDFELALGVGPEAKSVRRAFCFDVWRDQLIVRRATEREADVAALQPIKSGPGRAHLIAFLDQEKGRIVVFSTSGEQLANLSVVTGKPQAFGGVQLLNRGRELRLERLRISRWNGHVPQLKGADKARIQGPDGAVIFREVKSYDVARGELVAPHEGSEQRIPLTQTHDVMFPEVKDVIEGAAGELRAVHLSGQRVSGDLVKIEQGAVSLKHPGIREAIVSPAEKLYALTVLKLRTQPPKTVGRQGRLEFDSGRMHGALIDAREGDNGSLVWQPLFSTTAAPLARGIAARIVYRDPPPAAVAVSNARVRLRPAVPRPQTAARLGNIAISRRVAGQSVLHLRSGDNFPCAVTRIDEKGVHFKASSTDSTFVPHDQIKVLELMPDATPVAIAKQKKERLLTLPRMQRDNPPTHLIRAANGDYLRGRLVAMDDKELVVEVRLELKKISRQDVARVFWLHADELDADSKPETVGQSGTRVQALPPNGNRLTFFAEQLDGSILSGQSELLGHCHADLREIDQLLVGAAIEQSASSLSFHQWKLTPALEPLAAEDGDGDIEGLQSPLVGKPAPDFELELAGGGNFQLAKTKGSVIVLDFWASWCGPCLQVMPQVERVSAEFTGEHAVKLVSINLQETPDRIAAVLDRLQLKLPVAFDREGAVAEKYGASTIPQTVVIDRQGNVARVFTSMGAEFEEQLRASLQQAVGIPSETD